ncbi:hypothetical protein AVEN_101487-1 [Araneus ventricosus]|uniref:Uncharacterized protein n=1 Tax=Araneus ventricosus TaxID=182803 RepID=A0A4Y2JZK0_ARAVE|nr:hypothetical protein AVEN_101487-1 [Araneus ventricosus]
MIPENATLFSIFLLGKGIHEKTPCDVTAGRREYLRTAPSSEERLGLDRRDRLGERMPLEFYPQCELVGHSRALHTKQIRPLHAKTRRHCIKPLRIGAVGYPTGMDIHHSIWSVGALVVGMWGGGGRARLGAALFTEEGRDRRSK